jgi:hypothetical protein
MSKDLTSSAIDRQNILDNPYALAEIEKAAGIQGSPFDVPETDFGNIAKAPQLGVFDFRAFLNLAMLVSESDRAKLLHQAILDIVIDTINRRTGGGTEYISQRDEDFLAVGLCRRKLSTPVYRCPSETVSNGEFPSLTTHYEAPL